MCSGGSDWTCLQPGFPIRKSSDHSLVIDSPRLIADSYVLLRFLVPRHPPFALINLSLQRCSRPLCSSQGTGGPSLVPAPTAWCLFNSTVRWFVRSEGPRPLTGLKVSSMPEPSGPNNVSGASPARLRSTAGTPEGDQLVLATRVGVSAK